MARPCLSRLAYTITQCTDAYICVYVCVSVSVSENESTVERASRIFRRYGGKSRSLWLLSFCHLLSNRAFHVCVHVFARPNLKSDEERRALVHKVKINNFSRKNGSTSYVLLIRMGVIGFFERIWDRFSLVINGKSNCRVISF